MSLITPFILYFIKNYIEQGKIVYVPFPAWFEILYRKESFYEGVKQMGWYFPGTSDQAIACEHCIFQARRHNVTWLTFLDFDEYLWVSLVF